MNKLSVIDGETLLDMDLNAPRFCVQNFLPQGLSILGGAPKMGKSWLVMDLCVRIAKGEAMWNMETTKGTTLYLCLEDPYFRVQQRLGCITDEAPPNVFFANAASTLADDLEQQIIEFVKDHPDTVLIVIDTFQMVRASNGEPSYGGDYQELQKLKRIADALRISILLVHHLRKQGDRDPINRLSGTTGIGGAVDAIFILDSVYMFRRYGKRVGNPNLDRPYHWGQTTVRSILSNRAYVGDTVNFKTYSKSNKLKKRLQNAPENILIFENTHEAIIDRKTFDLVQKHFAGRKRPDKQGEVDKFAGYVFCGDCGKRLYLHRGKTIKPENNHFQCGGFQGRTTDCTAHYIRESVLENVVLTSLKKMTAFARENPDEFYAMAMENGEAEAKKFYDTVARQRAQIQSRIKDLDNIIRCLYEDRVCGRISPERYDTMASGYEQEQAELKQELESITARISEMNLREQYVREFMENARVYIEMPKLTPELLRVFIRCIEVYEKEEKYSRTCGNTMVIHYTFQMPKQKAVTATMASTAVTAGRKVA